MSTIRAYNHSEHELSEMKTLPKESLSNREVRST